jgi:hypothetical protein
MYLAWGMKTAYRVLVEEPEGKRPLGRPNAMWMDNYKIDLMRMGLEVYYIHVARILTGSWL